MNRLDHRFQSIHERALLAAEGFRLAEIELIDALALVHRERVFLRMGFSSLFVYATESLKLSGAVAYNSIAVMRKAEEVPELRIRIAAGTLSISQAKKIVPVLKADNQSEWLLKACTLSARNIEKEVARENPRAATPERARYISARRLDLRLGVDESLMLKLRRAQDLVSGSLQAPATLEATLEMITEFYLRHRDPVSRADRVVAKKGLDSRLAVPALKAPVRLKASTYPALRGRPRVGTRVSQAVRHADSPASETVQQVSGTVRRADAPIFPAAALTKAVLSSRDQKFSKLERSPIPAAIIHAVRVRDRRQCQFRASPQTPVCGSRRWVELHHRIPVNQGGHHSAENLLTLCPGHHIVQHAPADMTRQTG